MNDNTLTTSAGVDAGTQDDSPVTPNPSVMERITQMIGVVVTDLDQKKAAVDAAVDARKAAEDAEKAARDEYLLALNSAETTGGVTAAMLREFGHVKPRVTGRGRGRRAGTGRGGSRRPRAEVASTGNPSVYTDNFAHGADD